MKRDHFSCFVHPKLKLHNRYYHSVGEAAWVTCEAVGASEAGRPLDDSDAIEEFDGLFTASIKIKSNHSGMTASILPGGQCPIGA